MVPVKIYSGVKENLALILQRLDFPVQMFSRTALMSCHAADFGRCLIFGFGSSGSWFGFFEGVCLVVVAGVFSPKINI